MKRVTNTLLLLALIPAIGFAQQQEYTGTVTLIPQGPDFNAAYYVNKLRMKVDAGGVAVLSANLRFGPRSEPDDYVAFTGNISGSLQGDELSLEGSLNQAMQDGKRFTESAVSTRVTGQKKGELITGRFYMRYDGEEVATMTFSLKSLELVPDLLFPLGKSPKVFDRGWLFGASFMITDENDEELDLSDQIEWSGTASFEPARGSSSRPVFHSVGENKIILTAEHEGKKYSKEYKVFTVDANRYARVGSLAKCPADAHGCMADPFTVVGPVMTGNPNVLINGLPVACEGDKGRHAACAGPNTFTITGGDEEVLINGKKVAKLFSQTTHCGGTGMIISLESYVSNGMTALSKDVRFTDQKGKFITPAGNPDAGTKMITGPNGLVLISPDQNTVLMILPGSEAIITNNDGESMTILLENGQLFLNGEKSDHKKLVIESFHEKLVKKGTRFLFSQSKDSSRLIVYEGEVEVTLKNLNKTLLVPAGKVYFNDYKNPYVITDTLQFQASGVLMKIPKDSIYWQMPEGRQKEKPAENQSKGFSVLLKRYWYIAAGVVLLLMLPFVFRKKKKA